MHLIQKKVSFSTNIKNCLLKVDLLKSITKHTLLLRSSFEKRLLFQNKIKNFCSRRAIETKFLSLIG